MDEKIKYCKDVYYLQIDYRFSVIPIKVPVSISPRKKKS